MSQYYKFERVKVVSCGELDLAMVFLDEKEDLTQEISSLLEQLHRLESNLNVVEADLQTEMEKHSMSEESLQELWQKREQDLEWALAYSLRGEYEDYNGHNSVDQWMDHDEGRVPWEGKNLTKHLREHKKRLGELIRRQAVNAKGSNREIGKEKS